MLAERKLKGGDLWVGFRLVLSRELGGRVAVTTSEKDDIHLVHF